MIKISNLCLNFDEKIIFDYVNLEIPDNKFSVLIGANGTGKTTLFKMINNFLPVQNGTILNSFKKTFYLPQKINYPENLTLFEYITSYFYSNSFKWYLNQEEKDKTEQVLNTLELSDRKNILIDKLSSGELQKANIAIALLSKSDCLLLDEPTSNMDLINQIKTLDILKKLTQNNVTCVVIMHDINAAAAFGDYFIGIGKNHKIIQGKTTDFLTEENLQKIFGINFKVIKNENKIHIQINN